MDTGQLSSGDDALVNQMAQSPASEELRQAMSLVIDRNALAALTERPSGDSGDRTDSPEGYGTPWAETSARRERRPHEQRPRGADGCP